MMNRMFLFAMLWTAILAGPATSQQAREQLAYVCLQIALQGLQLPSGCRELADTPVCAAPRVVEPSPTVARDPVPTRAGIDESHVFFLNGGSRLDVAASRQLDRLAAVLNASMFQDACVRLVGHSDVSGDASINMRISTERAQAVSAYLARRLVNPAQIQDVYGEGEASPLWGEAGASPRNRRVAIWARPCA